MKNKRKHTESCYWIIGSVFGGLTLLCPLLKIEGHEMSWAFAATISFLFLVTACVFIKIGDKIFNIWLEDIRKYYEDDGTSDSNISKHMKK